MTVNLSNGNKVVGAKQVKRALSSATVNAVYIASDAESKVTSDIVELCEKEQIPIIYVESMEKLGNVCGIDINAAVAALLI